MAEAAPLSADHAALRTRILAVFERHRQRPGTPFDESHFLDYLLAAPAHRRAMYDSLAGRRRYIAMLDELQLEWGVCYSIKDFDGSLPLERFVARTAELIASPKSSLASLRHQEQRGFGGAGLLVVANIGLLMIVAAAHRYPVALGLAVAFVVAVNASFAWAVWRYRRYLAALRRRLAS